MNLKNYVKQGFRMLLFKESAVKAVITDKQAKENSTRMLFMLSALTGVLVGGFYYLMLYFVTRLEGGFTTAPSAWHFIVAAAIVFAVVLLSHLISVSITHLLARLVGSKRKILPYFSVWMTLGFATLLISVPVILLSLIPAVGSMLSVLFFIYSLTLTVFVVRESYAISTLRALVVVIVPVIIIGLALLAYFWAVPVQAP